MDLMVKAVFYVCAQLPAYIKNVFKTGKRMADAYQQILG